VAAQTAAVRQAMLDLEFTELRAPVSGRIGDRRVSAGNLVTGGTTGTTTLLATITSIDPIRFEYTMDETSYLRYMRLAGDTATAANRGIDVPVRLKLIDEPKFSRAGKTDFVDNAIDRASGTIRGRAEFPNPDGTLTPGMFGRIQVAAGPANEALLVPDVAIGTEQVRKFVLVVDGENVARPKYITLGAVMDGLRVVTAGLDADDRVIVNGLMRARPGVKVTPQELAGSADASAFASSSPTTAN
jgi:RND family efflux transporter MFP subunit